MEVPHGAPPLNAARKDAMTDNYESSQCLDERDAACLVFQRQRALAEHCLAQVDDLQFFARPAPGINSLAVLVQHLAGNLLSRWGSFDAMLRGESDGEKPWRDRDQEFIDPPANAESRHALMAQWKEGWNTVTLAMEMLTPEDFARTVTVRDVPHSVHLAVMRQIDHYGHHVGQIAMTARLLVGPESWRYFTIAPGSSAEYNRRVRQPHHDPAASPTSRDDSRPRDSTA
jgi:hypothetical protein